MTRHLAQQLIFFLAGLDVSSAEYERFTEWLQKGGVDIAVDLATSIRSELSHLDSRSLPSNRKKSNQPAISIKGAGLSGLPKTKTPRSAHASSDDKVFRDVYRLLIKEVRLKKTFALQLIADRIGYEVPIPEGLSFREGLDRLIAYGGESKVLSAAQMIRNREQDVAHMDWPLVSDHEN